MTDSINQHQTFLTRKELLALIAVNSQTILEALNVHLRDDLKNFDAAALWHMTRRNEELAKQVVDATLAEQQIHGGVCDKAELTCELTVSSPTQ